MSVSFRGLQPAAILAAVRNAGLQCIEWGSDIHAPCDELSQLRYLAAMQQENGIKCSSYGTYFRLGVHPITDLQAYIDAAKILGTDILRLWCGNKGSQAYSVQERKNLYDKCKAAALIAEANGVKLCMECHNGTLTDSKEAALELMQAVESAAFGMYWQPNQYCSFEENVAYARLLSPYTEHLHVFNWKGDLRFPLQDAISEWETYLSCFGKEKTLLLEFMPDDNIESLPTEAAALRAVSGVAL